jgi:hypothetical protein
MIWGAFLVLGLAVPSFCIAAHRPAHAAGEILITHTKALAGGVTPGDAPGYPVTLTLPGAYELASNLMVDAGKDGISVTTADVSLDLNGFTISGGRAGGAANGVHGVYTLGDRFSIKNGTITGFRFAGVMAPDRSHLMIDKMRIVHGGYIGIEAERSNMVTVTNSMIASNAFNGLRCALTCHVEGNIVAENRNTGIVIGTGTVLGNTLSANTAHAVLIFGRTGLGNNSIVNNNGGRQQIYGGYLRLFPNACSPVAC